MESTFYNMSQVLGITILQSLWQGLLVWFILRAVFMLMPSLPALKKHNLAGAALVTMCLWFIYSFINQMQAHVWVDLEKMPDKVFVNYFDLQFNNVAITQKATPVNYYTIIEKYFPYIASLYFAGLIFNLLKFALSLQRINLIKRALIPATEVQQFTNSFCKKLGISKIVKVNFSELIDVPCMTGYFKPIILLPISLATTLSADEIEAILLHELSHIKRNDYLLNLAQQIINILLFFNPFALLINRIINHERENSCDDLVVQTTAQPLVYAHALLKLEQTRQQQLQLALAATGKKYHLFNRIERIMKPQKSIGNIRHLLVAVVILTASISSIAWLNPAITKGKKAVKETAHAIMHNLFTDTVPKAAKIPAPPQPPAVNPPAPPKAPAKSQIAVDNTEAEQSIDAIPGNDAELEKLTNDIKKAAEKIALAYQGDAYNRYNKLAEKQAEDVMKYYNRPELQKLQEKQAKLSNDLAREYTESPKAKQIIKQIDELGTKTSEYYASSQFREMNEQLRKKYNLPEGKDISGYVDDSNNDNFVKYKAELESKLPADIKNNQTQMKDLGKQMRAIYSTTAYSAKKEQMRILSDSIKKAFNAPGAKTIRANMKKIQSQTEAIKNDPKVIEARKEIQEAQVKLNEYLKSPAYKNKLKTSINIQKAKALAKIDFKNETMSNDKALSKLQEMLNNDQTLRGLQKNKIDIKVDVNDDNDQALHNLQDMLNNDKALHGVKKTKVDIKTDVKVELKDTSAVK